MTFNFLNSAMLLGLAGVALPILAHLLSRKKYDVVEWGAMQFLELRKNARRRLRLEELLLLLFRMLAIALPALAFARPTASGGFLAWFTQPPARDVVLVIDGSYSMGWEGKASTPHANAVRWARELVASLGPEDAVAVIDAREQARPLVDAPTHDRLLLGRELNTLAPPSGTSNLADAVTRAVQVLGRGTHTTREVIVLTDGQALGWRPTDKTLWAGFDDVRQQPAVPPRVYALNVRDDADANAVNFCVERLSLSRELAVTDFPVRVETKIRSFGGEQTIARRVFFEVDGQRLSEKTVTLRLPPGGEAGVEFEHRFSTVGPHIVSVVLENDNLPGDNRADAAVSVAEALPVLLVDGSPHVDPTRSEAFFAKAALTARSNDTPWIRGTVVDWESWTAADLERAEVVLLLNVPRLSAEQAEALIGFVDRGGGLCLALGENVDAAAYQRLLCAEEACLLPAGLTELRSAADADEPVRVDETSLDVPWLLRFRHELDGGFTAARFDRWWATTLERGQAGKQATPAAEDAGDVDPARPAAKSTPSLQSGTPSAPRRAERAAIVLARLTQGDPLMIERGFGRGSVVLWTSTLDADGNTLPARPDYVSFLHELVFHLAGGTRARNVDVGMPLLVPVSPEQSIDALAFFGPDNKPLRPVPAGDELRPLARLPEARLPGVYTLRPKDEPDPQAANALDRLVVNFDRAESDLTPLSQDDLAVLGENERVRFLQTQDELQEQQQASAAPSEVWRFLLLFFAVLLVLETVITRRLVRGGHAVIGPEEAA